jgi:hypothetical protein
MRILADTHLCLALNAQQKTGVHAAISLAAAKRKRQIEGSKFNCGKF